MNSKRPRPLRTDASLPEILEWLESEVSYCAGVHGTKRLTDSLSVAMIHLRWAAGMPSPFDDEGDGAPNADGVEGAGGESQDAEGFELKADDIGFYPILLQDGPASGRSGRTMELDPERWVRVRAADPVHHLYVLNGASRDGEALYTYLRTEPVPGPTAEEAAARVEADRRIAERDAELAGKGWTVRRLREALEDFPDDAVIVTEGCDCDGDVGSVKSVKAWPEDGSGGVSAVFLARSDGRGV